MFRKSSFSANIGIAIHILNLSMDTILISNGITQEIFIVNVVMSSSTLTRRRKQRTMVQATTKNKWLGRRIYNLVKVLKDGRWSGQEAPAFVPGDNTGNAAAALMASFASKNKVLRDEHWSEQEAAILVPRNIISIKLGYIVQAGICLFEGDPSKIYQSALTGESFPVTKNPLDKLFSGSTCKQCEIETFVIASGVHTIYGKAAHLVDSTNNVGRGLRSLRIARQVIPEKTKESAGVPWQFVGLLPSFDPPRHDRAETIRRALNLGANVKIITGEQLVIAKVTGRRLGMGTHMYPYYSLLGQDKDAPIAAFPGDELIKKADGFVGFFPEHTYEIVKKLQERRHICGMIGDGVNDAPALKKADIGIAVADATDAARGASDIVLTEPGPSVIIKAVLTGRAIFKRMKNYTLCFPLMVLIWRFDFSPFMVLIIFILNDGTIMTISKDIVKSSPMPDSWKLEEIFATVLGAYMALMKAIFFWLMKEISFFSVAILIAVYPNWEFPRIRGIGWGWAGVIWLYSLITYVPLDVLKFMIRYVLSGKTGFTTKDYGKEEREAQWTLEQRTLHGLQPAETNNLFPEKSSYRELSVTEQAKSGELRLQVFENFTLKGFVESVVKLKGLDIDTTQQHLTV